MREIIVREPETVEQRGTSVLHRRQTRRRVFVDGAPAGGVASGRARSRAQAKWHG